MKEKIMIFYKEKFFLTACFLYALIFLFVLGNFYGDNFLPKVYYGKDFKSSYTKEEQKTIDEDGKDVVFTYGPYINLKKGTYIFTINYSGEGNNSFDITSKHGAVVLAKGELPKDGTSASVKTDIDENMYDSGIEIRTFYKGDGRFTFDSAEIAREGIFDADIANLAGAVIFFSIILFLVKSKMINKISFFCITALYVLFFGFMQLEFINFAIGYILLFVFTGIFLKFGNKLENTLKEIKAEEIISLLLTSYLIPSIAYLYINETAADSISISFIKTIGLPNILFSVSLFFGILSVTRIFHKRPYINYRIMFLFILWYSVKIIFKLNNNLYFAMGVILIMLYFAYFLFKDDKMKITDIKMKDTTAFILLCAAFLYTVYFVASNTVYRHKVFSTSTYDFGIFIQMFENMARSGLPVTTCERGELLSHFLIHFSPIYYLILPFYMLFRSPEGLLVIQAFAVSSVVFPVYMLSRRFKNSPFLSLVLSVAVMALPGFIAPAYFDFHENKFLAPLILWFVYFTERYTEDKKRKNLIPLFVFEALTLMVKEDAALYIIVLSLYYIIAKKEYKIGLITLFSSIIYFTAVMTFIQANGMGLMEGHYGLYYFPGQDGVLRMFMNIVQNPTFLIKNMFTDKTFVFMLYMMVPLMFIPLMCKNHKNLILLIPFVFINLMTDYGYQNDIGYQYTYGTGALLVFMFILNLKEKKLNLQYTICVTAVFASVFMLYAYKGESLTKPKNDYKENQESFEKKDNALKEYIPEDASVAAHTFILPHLYKHYELYTFDKNYDFGKQADYIVIYPTDTEYISMINEDEYKAVYSDGLLILKREE